MAKSHNFVTNLNSITVITLNCQGLRASSNCAVLFSWLNCFKPDIVCLQETHSLSAAEFESWVSKESSNGNNLQRYAVISSPGTARSRGVAILHKPTFKVEHVHSDDHGRLQIVTLTSVSSESSPFQLVNLYGPNRRPEGIAFFDLIGPLLDASIPLIMCGDFNTVVNPDLDRFGCNPTSSWAYNWPRSLQCLTQDFDLNDIWRIYHPQEREYTWHRTNGQQASRLDMFWLSSSLLQTVKEVAIYPFFRSDHSYVFLRISLPSLPERGRGIWKLNSSLLKDEEFCQQVRSFWQSWQLEKPTFPSLSVWWDAGKSRLKRLVRKYSKQKACSRRSRIKSLENTLHHLSRRQSNGDDVAQLIKEVREELELEHIHAAHGARVRAREQWAEEGETSSAYFLRQEKTRGVRKLFNGILNAQGVVVRSVLAILRVWCLFYVQLFTAAILNSYDQEFFINCVDLRLSDAEAHSCDGPVTENECLVALKSMKSNRSPGIDGLPYEFYERFWDVLVSDLVDTFNSCADSGCLAFSQHSAIITLLHKKNDKLDVKNWRPISLLCTDYKILSKALTNRLKSVIHSVVSMDQSCGIPDRFSSENVRALQDAVSYVDANNSGGAVISLDQEKAFDRVDWGFMLRVLGKMNFGPSFRSWVNLLYTDIFSRVLVNGFTSEAFRVTRGVRQGCPLSPLLYILVAETIASAIRKDLDIDGFLFPNGRTLKVFQYADDTSVLVMSDHSLRSLFALFDRYERGSGAKLNVSKSHGLLFGPWKDRTNMPVPLNWSNELITILGCRIGIHCSPDWESLLGKFEDQLALWKSRSLSFRGRVLVANMLGLSQFWYQATVFDVPKVVIHHINKILFPFVWNKKREWMARSSVTQPLADGGLGVVDVARKISSLRVIWLRRFLSD